jgi:hypothetical protein
MHINFDGTKPHQNMFEPLSNSCKKEQDNLDHVTATKLQ